MNGFSTKRLCRAGVIAALYVALTYAFGALSHQGILQIRPAEALCVLPLFFPEAIPALFVGCALSNLTSPFALYDVLVGAGATLLSSLLTYFAGRLFKGRVARICVGGIFPVLLNALLLPVVIVFLSGQANAESALSYAAVALSLLVTESVWVYGLGTPLYLFIDRMRRRSVSAFCEGKPTPPRGAEYAEREGQADTDE